MTIDVQYEVVYWKTAEHRKQGISDFAGSRMSLKDAVFLCNQLVHQQGMASAEVRAERADDDETHEVIVLYCGPGTRWEICAEE